jgi:hypothetical protein
MSERHLNVQPFARNLASAERSRTRVDPEPLNSNRHDFATLQSRLSA